MYSRRTVRLARWDYARPGAYFITLCTHDREALFGEVVDGRSILNEIGEIVRDEWERTPAIRREVTLDVYVVMPNHVHAVIWIGSGNEQRRIVPVASGAMVRANGGAPVPGSGTVSADVGAHGRAPLHASVAPRRSPRSLGALVAGSKAAVTFRVNARRGTPGVPVWQRSYHEHVVRDERSLDWIRRYILENPLR